MTTISHRYILEQTILKPKYSTAIVLANKYFMYYGGEGEELSHGVMGVYPDGFGGIGSALDFSSMQFGEPGRGPGKKDKIRCFLH